jgi:hypothetical protein
LLAAGAWAQHGGGGHGGGGGHAIGGGGGGFHGGSSGIASSRGFSSGGGIGVGVGIGGYRGGVGYGGVGYRGGYGYGYRGYGGFGFGFGLGYYPYGYGYWPGYYGGYYDYGYPYGYYDSSYYSYPAPVAEYNPSPNVTVVYAQPSQPTYSGYYGAPAQGGYDQYGQPIGPAPRAAAPPPAPASAPTGSPIYLIAFKDHSIQAAASYFVTGATLHYVTLEHQEKQAPLDSVDRALSGQLNRERRVAFALPN